MLVHCSLELCADFTVSAAARRSISVGGGGAHAADQKEVAGGAAWLAMFSNLPYLLQTFFSKESVL